MNAVESIQQQPHTNLEPPSAELVEKLNVIMEDVFVPAGLPQLKPEEFNAVKLFACQLPISQGFNPITLHLLHRIVLRQFVVGTAKTTVDWPMLLQAWTDLCVERNRQHLVVGLPLLLNWCFEPSNIRVIGLCELEWDVDNRQITIRTHRPNFTRMAEYLQTAFNLDPGNSAHNPVSNTV